MKCGKNYPQITQITQIETKNGASGFVDLNLWNLRNLWIIS